MQKILVRQFLPALAALPVISLIICVVWTVAEDPLGLTRTHCSIPNYVPSLSASVASGLRKRIWIASIGLSCSLLDAFNRNFMPLFPDNLHLKGKLSHAPKCLRPFRHIVCALWIFGSAHPARTSEHVHSLRRKSHLYALMTVSILLSAVCYLLHNRYCISHVYSVFALFEHIFILSNLAFHYYVIDVIGDLPLMFSDPITRTLSLNVRP
ncbi:Post-GPI attachment to protein factor 2 [Taenia crassiceps]|uniref:Post-GPI attachment to protein factor 2 n=1 Tax=Taenia crassiceps TaxID=6207 RepID=A0ABR4QQY1_9CEST